MNSKRDVREIIREEMVMKDKILAAMQEESMTVMEIADAVGYPSHEVMYWVMGLRKYSILAEDGVNDEGFFRYKKVPKEEE